ncbi:hypothetical protein BDV32DRAFT_40768 [Aspergillus pseudonomiae]|uniref:Uncharacterized protein n=1 Tax=Aspergillus pseudonomiae TaxID=1506151 RepID=A0A5N7CWX9_9EURO|nr:uncharacterized protein BDV37DRAFT_41540 [Aspergillus pseudonomiae]KAB8261238.1 hypothetical protein BDV32DRAFT_40768 [Aspergillus pseudonomiae]KAE8398088.1 hypothetical protein BDV37DRAFT_41540 [Aspergillus pseudonomiae]
MSDNYIFPESPPRCSAPITNSLSIVREQAVGNITPHTSLDGLEQMSQQDDLPVHVGRRIS